MKINTKLAREAILLIAVMGLGVLLPYLGWKITAVTIVDSWLNTLGCYIIYSGNILVIGGAMYMYYTKP